MRWVEEPDERRQVIRIRTTLCVCEEAYNFPQKVHCSNQEQILFFIEYNGREDAESFREMVDKNLHTTFGKLLSNFALKYTFVTDCAPTMAWVCNASVSERI